VHGVTMGPLFSVLGFQAKSRGGSRLIITGIKAYYMGFHSRISMSINCHERFQHP
jgi:hypothetical protein